MRSKKEEREHDVREAFASVQLEGYKLSEYIKNISQMYIEGKITAQEQVAIIRAHYGLKVDMSEEEIKALFDRPIGSVADL